MEVEEEGKKLAAKQLQSLTRKHKLFYPDEILFEGETIEWIHKLTLRELLSHKFRWIIILSFVFLIALLVIEPFLLHFARSIASIEGPVAFIPLVPFLIIPFYVLFTNGIIETLRASPPAPPPAHTLKIQSPRFQYELPDPFVDFLRQNKELRSDESRWICIYSLSSQLRFTSTRKDIPTKFEMWKNSVVGMLFLCIVTIWVSSVILLHFTVHQRVLRHKFGDYILFLVPIISLVTWMYYNFLMGKIIAAIVLTERHILTMGYGLWFLFTSAYHNGLYFLVSTPIDASLGLITTELSLGDKSGRLWASHSSAPFSMLGPNVMVRAEIVFRKQFEMLSIPPE